MATEPKRIVLRIDADPRLAAAAGGAARYFGDAAGLEGDAVTRLQAATVAACEEAFEHLTLDHPYIELTLARLADRIEVEVSHPGGNAPAVGLDTIARFVSQAASAGEAGKGAFLSGVDRVQYEMQGGAAVTRLTKYLGPHPTAV